MPQLENPGFQLIPFPRSRMFVIDAAHVAAGKHMIHGLVELDEMCIRDRQEMPQVEMFRTFTKASFTIERTEDIPEQMAEAYRHALSGRPGPVFVELPFDVLFNACLLYTSRCV